MKLLNTQLHITSNNQKLYSVYYQTTEGDLTLVLESIENYLRILYDNEHITLIKTNTEYMGDDKYHSWYLEPIPSKEIPDWDTLNDIASYLENYFGYHHDKAMHIVLLNLTPLTQALNTKYDSYIDYNTDYMLMELSPDKPEDLESYDYINIPHINGNIYIIIDWLFSIFFIPGLPEIGHSQVFLCIRFSEEPNLKYISYLAY